MTKRLLLAGGILNTLFFLFHVFLGYQFRDLAPLPPPYLGLLEAFNFGSVLFFLFFAYASFFHDAELLRTGLGQAVLVLAAALYLSRAAEELFLFQFMPAMFGSCVLTGAIYVGLIVMSRNERHRVALLMHGDNPTPEREAQRLHHAA